MSERRLARPLSMALAVGGTALVLTGAVCWWAAPPGGSSGAAHRVLPQPPVAVVPGVRLEPDGAVPASARSPGVPVRVEVPALGVDVPVVPVRASGHTLVPPSDPFELGWWSDGPRPGEDGAAVVTGHTVHDGPGALNGLGRLRSGDLVSVRTRASVITYRVVLVRRYSHASLARHAGELFARSGPSRLLLVTCSGWDGHLYVSNVVVTATPV